MPIPSDFIQTLLERVDLSDLIGADVKLQKKGANWVGLCPFHGEKTPSFTVNPAKGFYHCFGCGAHGDAIAYMQKHYGLDFFAAVERLATSHGLTVPQQGGRREDSGRRNAVNELLTAAMHFYQQQLRKTDTAKEYLKSRGMSGDTAKLYKIGYAPDSWDGLKQALASQSELLLAAGLIREKEDKSYDYFRKRIIFPIIDGSGKVCGFGGRALSDDDPPKYLNSAENNHFSKRRLLYGLPQAAKAAQQKKRLIICEGYMDVVMLAQGGFPEGVATMGTAATVEQMKKAARLVPNIYLAYDGDAAGQKGAFRAMQGVLPALKDGISIFFLFLPEGHDPDSYIRDNGGDAFEQLLASAQPLGDYLLQALAQQADATSEEGQKTAIMKEGAQLLQMVSQQDAPAWRSLLAKKLEDHTGVPLPAARPPRAAPAPPPGQPKVQPSALRLRPQSLLYNLLCCLSSKPALAEHLPIGLPLPGINEQEVEIVGGFLGSLRWQMHDEGDDDGLEDPSESTTSSIDVPALLEAKGYVRLAEQLRETVKRRFHHTGDIEAELNHIVTRLEDKHNRLTRPGKKSLKEKLDAAFKHSAPQKED